MTEQQKRSVQTVAIDQTETASETDEAYSSELQSYATSLSSSIQNYNWEHGRRFHSYREGSYKFPNDEREQERMNMVHHMFKLVLGGKLFLAPIQPGPLRVLDIGTGTGIWAIDLADQFPSAELVLGNDLSPIQPTWVPPNVVFEVDDVESDWPSRKAFDFIHSRYMCGSIVDWPRLFKQAYKQTKKGGWIEFQDFHLVNYSEDNTLDENSSVIRLYKLLEEACRKMGRPNTVGVHLKQWAQEAGFKNIHHEVFKLPLGLWPMDPIMKEIGAFNLLQFLDGLEAFTISTFTNVLGWSVPEVQLFLSQVRNDAKKRGSHIMHDFHVVYAQRLD
ncbi:hypothetical protein MPDQ_002834 [Monascus purpureus]|uniref:S-adenosyl-L-methionine-dependent methyltransferase n=1 Tax=Monascus purpureus TaxID=5098 RepID=A0A507QNS3_MONPU|nr:hypothetical protein MPDQ_002834 [Monascus purpureus]BDD56741.1 hypothetical protein MAP00_002169 [Monascus purpureus]